MDEFERKIKNEMQFMVAYHTMKSLILPDIAKYLTEQFTILKESQSLFDAVEQTKINIADSKNEIKAIIQEFG